MCLILQMYLKHLSKSYENTYQRSRTTNKDIKKDDTALIAVSLCKNEHLSVKRYTQLLNYHVVSLLIFDFANSASNSRILKILQSVERFEGIEPAK